MPNALPNRRGPNAHTSNGLLLQTASNRNRLAYASAPPSHRVQALPTMCLPFCATPFAGRQRSQTNKQGVGGARL
jgi:hypothetical protein